MVEFRISAPLNVSDVARPVSIATVVAAANVAAALHRGSERLGDLREFTVFFSISLDLGWIDGVGFLSLYIMFFFHHFFLIR